MPIKLHCLFSFCALHCGTRTTQDKTFDPQIFKANKLLMQSVDVCFIEVGHGSSLRPKDASARQMLPVRFINLRALTLRRQFNETCPWIKETSPYVLIRKGRKRRKP